MKILLYGPRGPLGQWLEGRLKGVTVDESGPEYAPSTRPRDWSVYDLAIVDSRAESGMGELGTEIRSQSHARPRLIYLLPVRIDPGARDRMLERCRVDAWLPLPVDLDQLEKTARQVLGSEEPPPATEAGDRVSISLGSLWDKYRPLNLQRVEKLEQAVASILEGKVTAEQRRDAAREAHKLVGAAGTFGFPEASAKAREVEAFLESGEVLGESTRIRLSDLVESLRDTVESGTTRISVASDQEVFLIIDARKQEAGALSSAAARRGLLPVVAPAFVKAWDVLERSNVRAVVLDLELEEGNVTGSRFLGKIKGRFADVPVIVLSESESTLDRVEVSRFGGRGFFQRDRDAQDIVDSALQLLRLSDERPRILAVDDDPDILELLRTALSSLSVTTLNNPGGFMEKFREVDPEIVILDVDMPKINGLDLCRALRMDDRASHTPVMVLTAHRSTEIVKEVFEAGADDYLTKPFIAEELIARINSRIIRSRLARQLMERDSLTGCFNRDAFVDRFARLASIADESRRSIAFALFRLQGLSEINQRLGHAAGDGALVRMTGRLREKMGGDELIGRWGGAEIVMTLFGLDREEGAERIQSLVRGLNELVTIDGRGESFLPWVAAAVGQYPADGRAPLELFQSTDRVSRAASLAGVRSIVTTSWEMSEEGIEVVDVAIVDDDETVSSLLEETLETWRYDVATISDGLEAVERLAGPRPSLRARAVLLDVDMPKMDGHSVLRRLREAGVLNETRVIMLTVRGSESDVLASMRMGAFDHMTKPFSVPVLLERLRRALGS